MTGTPLAIPVQGLRRRTGSAGPPATLLAGQTFNDEVGGIMYIGVGNDGSGNATSIVPLAGQGLFASVALGALLSALPTTPPATAGQAWLNGGVLSVS